MVNNMSTPSTYDIKGIDLSDDSYTVEQSLVRNKYKAMDAAGNVVLRGKQKMLKMKEQFPFVDGNGDEVFEVNAGGIIDVAGNYVLTDSKTGEDIVILDNDYSIFQDTWKIRDASTEAKIAEINSQGALVTIARNVVPFGGWIPHKYEITDQDGTHVGNIDGQFSLKDRYEITIDDASTVPKEPIIAAAMVIDAIQGN
ncbi:unknown [Haloarcula marismortui ATCC 43049]|uniref:Uncharacterized protein n=3 Tax=Haloarcula marismortui TaxID=2238 RepID=Q5V0I7_HALMA|nr:unknown [Haloarcula marismortui ATCC 43049]